MLNLLANQYRITPPTRKDGSFPFLLKVGGREIAIQELGRGVRFFSHFRALPEKKHEALFAFLMKANFLGQGTGGAAIGIDKQEKYLTLSLDLPYEVNYEIVREKLEDYINFMDYWADEIEKFVKQG
ncbi:MAG: type III secretion system chaperone [Simkaniaceae bacterium]|nr:type III secretion system chaperone [Simkaniaceae bacterium]